MKKEANKARKQKKSTRNILIAFILNLSFAIIELIGGYFTNSMMIITDAFHDFGDATSLGVSFVLEKKSEKKADNTHTYGYARYSIISALLMSLVLIVGAVVMAIAAIQRLLAPEIPTVDAFGMLILAVVGIGFNLTAALITRGSRNLNERSTFLHMLEDVFGWIVVLIGAILMLTIDNPNIYIIDPILTIVIAVVIFISALRNLFKVFAVLLERAPKNFPTEKFLETIKSVEQVKDAHHLHVWTLTGQGNLGTVHVQLDENMNLKEAGQVRQKINEVAHEFDINHMTVQFETAEYKCIDGTCEVEVLTPDAHHHHHH